MVLSTCHTRRLGSQGSSSGLTPVAWAITRVTSAEGEANSTLAHTPSVRPGVTPSTVLRLWVMKRSIPGVGTATNSRANGSVGIRDRSCERPVSSASVRSLR